MSKIAVWATYKVHDGKEKDLRKFAEKLVSVVRENEPLTTQYDWYISSDGRTCLISEVFANSEAALEHMHRIGDFWEEGLKIGELEMKILGEPSAELRKVLEPLSPMYYGMLAGL